MSKPVAIYFFQYLPPWRIDVFNEIANHYQLTLVFWNADCEGFTYNRQELLSKLNSSIEVIFLQSGINAGTHSIRLGVTRLILQRNPQVVFSHEYAPISMQCALIKRLGICEYKLVITTSDNLYMAKQVSGLKSVVRRRILRYADKVILYSPKVEDWYTAQFPSIKTAVCPNIQNPQSLLAYKDLFPPIIRQYKSRYNLNESKILLYVGRITYVKGLDLLLQSFYRVKHEGWKIVLVGDGDERASLMRMADDLDIADDVVFADFCSVEYLYAWYHLANCFVLPSRYEPYGAVVNEALVYGCPVLASKYIGALDMINDSNGMIFDPNDSDDFESTLSSAMQRYNNVELIRENRMPYSFGECVSVYMQI